MGILVEYMILCWMICLCLANYFSVLTNRTIVSDKSHLDTKKIVTMVTCTGLCFVNNNCSAAEFDISTGDCNLYAVLPDIQTEQNDRLSTILPDSKTDVQCPDGWIEHFERCYFFSDVKKTWHEAKNFCESIHNNSFLAEPKTREEIDFIKSTTIIKGYSFWIGGTDEHNESDWIWATSKSQITDTDWDRHNPNNDDLDEHCLQVYKKLNFKWNDQRCWREYRLVCEKT